MDHAAGMEVITKYFPDLSKEQHTQFSLMKAFYEDWNAKINVVSRKDIEELYVRHVLHSLGISKALPFTPNSRILDVGTGGGFPGIPLAILFPECKFHLVDSIGKKIKVVDAAVEALKLKNVTTAHIRGEAVDDQFDFVISRAVTQLAPFYSWVKKKFLKASQHSLKNGILYLKGGDLKEELLESKLRYKTFDLAEYFDEPFFETKKVVYVPSQ